jgi:transposase
MPGPKAIQVVLSEEEEKSLEFLVRRHHTRQQIALRARIVLLAGQGESNSAIVRKLAVDLSTVQRWRKRWVQSQGIELADLSAEDRLEDLPRPGKPPRITADQRCQIEALACEDPDGSDRPITEWTGREIADEIIKRQIVPSISSRHAARLLKRC